MEDIKDAPVEVYRVKNGSFLYQMAYIGDNQYFLYKVFSPIFGFLNWIPYINLKRKAQIVDESIAKKNIYRLDMRKGKATRVGWGMIGGVLVPIFISGNVRTFLYENKYLLVVGTFLVCLTTIFYLKKKAQANNELIRDFSPDVVIRLKNNNLFFSKRIGLYFFIVLTVIMSITAGMLDRILMTISMSLIPFAFYDFYPDDEELKYTENRIDVIIDPNQKNGNDKINKRMQSSKIDTHSNQRAKKEEITKTIPFITMSFSDYWSGNQNTGRTMTHKLK